MSAGLSNTGSDSSAQTQGRAETNTFSADTNGPFVRSNFGNIPFFVHATPQATVLLTVRLDFQFSWVGAFITEQVAQLRASDFGTCFGDLPFNFFAPTQDGSTILTRTFQCQVRPNPSSFIDTPDGRFFFVYGISLTNVAGVPHHNAHTVDSFNGTFSVSAKVPGLVMSKSAGDNQTGAAGATLRPLKVLVADGLTGAPAQGVPISFSVSSEPPADLQPRAAVTGPDGIASTVMTLGNVPGTNVVRAACDTCSGNPDVFFSETAALPPTVNGLVIPSQTTSCSSVLIGGTTVLINADGSYSLTTPGPLPKDAIFHCQNPALQCPTSIATPFTGQGGCGSGLYDPNGATRRGNSHQGADYAGTAPVLSPVNGTVLFVGEFVQGDVHFSNGPNVPKGRSWGWVVVIQGDQAYKDQRGVPVFQYILLGHLNPTPPVDKTPVHAGERVSLGQDIGWAMDTTGNANKAGCPTEVHVEMRLSTTRLIQMNGLGAITNPNPVPGSELDMRSKTINGFTYGQIFQNCGKFGGESRRCIQSIDPAFPKNRNTVNPDHVLGCHVYK